MADAIKKKKISVDVKENIYDSFRQFFFPAEFRINMPIFSQNDENNTEEDIEAPPPLSEPVMESREEVSPDKIATSMQMVADLATCLWYMKTKYFKQEWENEMVEAEDPRTRRAIGRLNKAIDMLLENGFEIHDPTNKRYSPGSEGMMRPIQFNPKAGLTFEQVTETVAPIIYYRDKLLQRGEVFVAVPQEQPSDSVPADELTDKEKQEETVLTD